VHPIGHAHWIHETPPLSRADFIGAIEMSPGAGAAGCSGTLVQKGPLQSGERFVVASRATVAGLLMAVTAVDLAPSCSQSPHDAYAADAVIVNSIQPVAAPNKSDAQRWTTNLTPDGVERRPKVGH
jgi:hypothetical protein